MQIGADARGSDRFVRWDRPFRPADGSPRMRGPPNASAISLFTF
jgi:hypothetical protein